MIHLGKQRASFCTPSKLQIRQIRFPGLVLVGKSLHIALSEVPRVEYRLIHFYASICMGLLHLKRPQERFVP